MINRTRLSGQRPSRRVLRWLTTTGTAHFEPIRYPLSIHWRLHPQLASDSDFHWMPFGLPSQIDLPPTCFRQRS